MKNENQMKIRELLLRIISPLIFLLIGTCIIYPFAKGVPIFGVPKTEDIVKVEITDHRSGETVVYTDAENIQLAVNMKNFSIYKINNSVTGDEALDISIKYFVSDDLYTELSAGDTTVYWKGKTRNLKNEGWFVKLAEAVFF